MEMKNAIYAHPRIIAMMFLGFVSGLPLILTASTLTIRLKEIGVSNSAIGLFALIGTPYVIKFLWSPLVDQLPFPILTRMLGKRRGWMVGSQIALMISIILLGLHNPVDSLWLTAFLALCVTTCSATQDIVIDAYRVEMLEDYQQGAGAGASVFGYRLGMLVSGAGALFIAHYAGWVLAYMAMAALILAGIVTVMVVGEPENTPASRKHETFKSWVKHAAIDPFADFMQRYPHWMMILFFIIFYKLGDAFAGIMTGPFLVDIGFDKQEIATIQKIYGLVATLAGAFLGGVMVARLGMLRTLWICGLLQMLSNLMFVWQAEVGYSIGMLMLTITAENFSGGMGTAAFVAYLSLLCDRQYTATQYALLSSLSAAGRSFLSGSAGIVVDSIGWSWFFLSSTLIALPGLVLLWWLKERVSR